MTDERERVNLAHLGPWQRMLLHRRGVGADMVAMCGGLALRGVQILHRIDRHLGRQIGGMRVARRVEVVADDALLTTQGPGCRGSHVTTQIRDRWTASQMD
jgi:hypothetical protein